jgi:hypothetical protein
VTKPKRIKYWVLKSRKLYFWGLDGHERVVRTPDREKAMKFSGEAKALFYNYHMRGIFNPEAVR